LEEEMENRMRSLWDFGAEDDGSGAIPPTDMGYQPNPSAPLSLESIGPQIHARLEAGDPPGKIAMHLEQLEPGLGRALLSELQHAARSGPSGSTSEVVNPFLAKGANGPQIRPDDRYAPPQFSDASERDRVMRASPQFGPPYSALGAGANAPAAADKPPPLSPGSSGEEDETDRSVTDEVPGAGGASLDELPENIGDLIQARLQAGHPPGRVAMDLEQVRPGLGRALLSELQQAARSNPSGTTSEVVKPFLAKGVNGPPMPRGDRYAPPEFFDASERDRAIRGTPQFGSALAELRAGPTAPAVAGKPPLLRLASIKSAAAHREMAANTRSPVARHSGRRPDPPTFWSRVGGLLNQGRRFLDPGTTVINRDGSRYKRFGDGSIEMGLPPVEPFRKPLPRRVPAAASAQTRAARTSPPRLAYDVKEGVTIDDFVAGKLDEMGPIFTKETGKRFTVTDGTRNTGQQASAMYHDFVGGESGGKYIRKDLVRPIYDAYLAARARKASPAATIAEMKAVIDGQVRNGDLISKHLIRRGIDLRIRDLTTKERGALERAARKVGAKLKMEGDHLHGEF
jgi:hypothetical protein